MNLTKDVDIDGGSFTMSLGGTLNTMTIRNNGSFIIGSGRTVTLNGLFTWSRGTVTGGGSSTILNSNGGGSFASTATGGRVVNNVTWRLSGTNTWSGNNFTESGNTSVSLISGAALNISNSQGAWTVDSFINSGTINRNSGTGTITFIGGFRNNNRLDVNAGTIFLNNNTTQLSVHTGQFNVASTSTLRFIGDHQSSTGSIHGAGQVILDSGLLLISNTYNMTGGTQVFGGLLQFSASSSVSNLGGLTVTHGEVFFGSNPATIGAVTISNGLIDFSTHNRSLSTLNMTGGTMRGNGNTITIAANSTFSGGTITGSGVLTINAGITLTINGSSNKSILERSITNNGTISWSGSGNLTSQFQLNNNGTINLASSGSAGQGEWSGGIILNSNTVNANDGRNVIKNLFLNQGTCNIPAGGDLQLLGGGSHSISSSFRLTSTGTTGTTQAVLSFENNHTHSSSASINNLGGQSVVEFRSGQHTINGFYSMHTTIVSGAGTVVNINSNFSNTGIVNVQNGRLNLEGAGTHTGNFTVSANAILEFKTGTNALNAGSITVAHLGRLILGGTMTQGPSSSLSNGGNIEFTGHFTSSSANFNLNGLVIIQGTLILNSNVSLNGGLDLGGTLGGSGIVTLDAVNLNWTSGNMAGTGTTRLAQGRVLSISGTNFKRLQNTRKLVIRGESRWSDGIFIVDSGAELIVENPGVFDIRTLQTMQGSGKLTNGGGTVKKTAGPGIQTLEPQWLNAGNLQVLVGRLKFTNIARKTAGTTLINAFTDFAQPYIVQDGAIQGTSLLRGNLVMLGGSLEPGVSPGVLTIEGNLTLHSDSRYFVEIGGTDASQIDKVIVQRDSTGGTADLAGTLEVSFINGYVPQLGDAFMVMEYLARNGQFDEISVPTLPQGLRIVSEYRLSEMLLKVALDRIPGDVDGDGCVNDEDLLAVLFAFGQSGGSLPPDLNGDGAVNDEDLLIVLFNFGNGC